MGELMSIYTKEVSYLRDVSDSETDVVSNDIRVIGFVMYRVSSMICLLIIDCFTD